MNLFKREVFFQWICLFVFALLFAFPKAAFPVSAAAARAVAKSVAVPDVASLFNETNAKEVLEHDRSATATLEALRATGGERLYEPGRADVDACYAKSDTRCAAVVIVDRGAGTRATVNPDPTGEITASYEVVKSGASELIPELAVESSVGSCRRVSKTLTGAALTHTCDIRVGLEETAATEEKQCLINLETLTQRVSTYRCVVENFREFETVVSVPVIPTYSYTTTVTCLEGKRNAETRSCTVVRTSSDVERHEATCITPRYKAVKKTCRRRLTVKPVATCTPGSEVAAIVSDTATLTEDDVAGCDTLKIAYRCNAEGEPKVAVATNGGGGSDFSIEFVTADTVIDETLFSGENTLHFYGNRSCDEGACRATVTMEVYKGKGEGRLYFGAVRAILNFMKFSLTSETESWEETCVE